MKRILSLYLVVMMFFCVGYAAEIEIGSAEDLPAEELLSDSDQQISDPEVAVEPEAGIVISSGESVGAGEGIEDESVFDQGPYAVYIVEAPYLEDSEISSLALGDSAYLGTISSTVYEYFRDLAATGIPWNADYVFYRAGQYDYRLVYGTDLSLDSGTFSGSDVHVINYYSYSYNDSNRITRYDDSAFTLEDPGAFVYTNLGSGYPELYSGVSIREFKAFFVLIGVCCLYVFIRNCFGR